MSETTLSSQLYSSRDQTKLQIIEYLKTYLELENVDLTKSSFLSFIVEILSTLTSNLVFYESSVFSEFFLTKAKLPESILNLAAFLGYNTKEASYSNVDVLITIPLTFTDNSVEFSIPNGHKFYAKSIEFLTYYDTKIKVTNNNSLNVTVNESGLLRNIPTSVDTTAKEAYFVLPLRQIKNSEFDFQINEDLQPYQFSYLDVDLSGKVSSLTVKIKSPESTSYTLYEEYDSLFLMDSKTYGYVNRKTSGGRRIYFGNGLVGFQPIPGSNVLISVVETEGSLGNVISGTISSGDRLYAIDDGITKVINYSVTNPTGASGGKDEEDTEEVRNNAISNLTSLGRLVTENDYKNVKVVIPDSPLGESAYPVLKRSDVKSEIDLFTTIEYNSSIVPTRNTFIKVPSDTTSLPRLNIVNISGIKYYTIFDMNIDSKYNNVVTYEYTIFDVDFTPTLIQSYNIDYELYASILYIERFQNQLNFKLSYNSDEADYNQCSCIMTIQSNDKTYIMTNDYNNKEFTYSFSNYKDIPNKEQNLLFTLYDPTGKSIARYSTKVTIRRDLKDYMLSPLTTDSTSITIYDVPVIKKDYYDDLDQKTFELNVLQSMMSNINFINYRMLTDFVNLKFCNTIGKLTSMNYNTTSKLDVIDMDLQKVPSNFSVGDRYIVSGCEDGDWDSDQKNNIAQAIDSTSWTFLSPVYNDIVYVKNKKEKYIFTGQKWVQPTFDIPIQIVLDVYTEDSYTKSSIELSNSIKSSLISTFTKDFKINGTLYRSEITKAVQSVNGVDHCVLVSPDSDIFSIFDIDDFSQSQLLKYAPDYMYFDNDSISINIL